MTAFLLRLQINKSCSLNKENSASLPMFIWCSFTNSCSIISNFLGLYAAAVAGALTLPELPVLIEKPPAVNVFDNHKKPVWHNQAIGIAMTNTASFHYALLSRLPGAILFSDRYFKLGLGNFYHSSKHLIVQLFLCKKILVVFR